MNIFLFQICNALIRQQRGVGSHAEGDLLAAFCRRLFGVLNHLLDQRKVHHRLAAEEADIHRLDTTGVFHQPVHRLESGVGAHHALLGILAALAVAISMTNAAMNTQLVLDRFRVTHLLVSGIAGGVNPALHIGDVTVAQRWGQYLEVLMAREVTPGKYAVPAWMDDVKLPNFGMLYPRPVSVRSAGQNGEEKKFWFEVNPQMLALARSISNTALTNCTVCIDYFINFTITATFRNPP